MLNAHAIFTSRGVAQAAQLERALQNVQKIDPDFWVIHMLRELERAVEVSDGMPLALQTLGLFHAGKGHRREAEGIIARLEQRSYPPPGVKERDGAMIDLLGRGWAEARKTTPRIADLAKHITEAKR